MVQDLKQQINELLFQTLNERTTLREFEDIAITIYEAIITHNDTKTRML